ncbi:MAG: glycosyltransferase [Methanobacteriota archaeon]|nr:MAG: glycosyltransferase [Euryarchaeota archaeon]
MGERDGHDPVRAADPSERRAVQRARALSWHGALRDHARRQPDPRARLAEDAPVQCDRRHRRPDAGAAEPIAQARVHEALLQPAVVARELPVRARDARRFRARLTIRHAGPAELLRSRDAGDALDRWRHSGVEFSPAAYGLKRPLKDARGDDPDDGVYVHAIPGEGWGQPIAAHLLGRSGGVARYHAGLLDGLRPDVIHHHNVSLLGRDVFVRRANARSLYTAHDYWVRCPRSDLLKYGKYPCVTPTCVRCALLTARPPQMWRYSPGWHGLSEVDCAIAPSVYMAHAIESSVGCPVVHIPNFAPDGRVSMPEDGLGGYFLFVGVLESHKGVAELVRASTRRSAPIRIVGRGSLSGELKHLARRDRARVQIEGWVSRDELLRLYRGAKALVIPSLWPENAPLAAIEALSCGTPLLVSRRGGLEELLHGGAAGYSFEPAEDGIADAMDRFERRGDPAPLRASARQTYERYHRPEAYLEKYLEVAKGDVPVTSAMPGGDSGSPPVGGLA